MDDYFDEQRLYEFEKGVYFLTKEVTPKKLLEHYKSREPWKWGFKYSDWDTSQTMVVEVLIRFSEFSKADELKKLKKAEEEKIKKDMIDSCLYMSYTNEVKNIVDNQLYTMIESVVSKYFDPRICSGICDCSNEIVDKFKEMLPFE